MERTWAHQSRRGVTALIHPETHFTDDKGGVLRAATYRRLRRHWQFINELKLFEIQHQKTYGVHVYGASAMNRTVRAWRRRSITPTPWSARLHTTDPATSPG